MTATSAATVLRVRSARPQMTAVEIRERMSGNICRCAAYPNIIAAMNEVAGERKA